MLLGSAVVDVDWLSALVGCKLLAMVGSLVFVVDCFVAWCVGTLVYLPDVAEGLGAGQLNGFVCVACVWAVVPTTQR